MNAVLISLSVILAVCGASLIYAGKKTGLKVNSYRIGAENLRLLFLTLIKKK
jgi:hypothetical protein